MTNKKAAPNTRSRSPRGAIPLGRVQPDHAAFVWNDFSAEELKHIAESISKDLEMHYQLELLERSGFGQT